jgi:multidrug transporter EmrE-like cation transporter
MIPASGAPRERTFCCESDERVDRGSRLTTSRTTRTLVVLALAILANGAGNLSLSYGMKSVGPPEDWTLAGLWAVVGAALSSVPVIAGGLLLLVFFALFLSLLSWADLSYVLPMISSCFVVSALLGHLVLGERISLVRWTGIALVMIGVLLVGRTGPSSDASRGAAP